MYSSGVKTPSKIAILCSNHIGMHERGSGLCATCVESTQECICTYDGQYGKDLCLRQATNAVEPWFCGLADTQDSNCSSSIIDEENTETAGVGYKHYPV